MELSELSPLYDVQGDPEQQIKDLAASDAAIEITGGDPLQSPPVTAQAERASLAAYIADRISQTAMRDRKKDEIDSQFDLKGLNKFRYDVLERYKKHNAGLVAEDPTIRAWQSRPIELDPNELAHWNQVMSQWHNARVAAGIGEGVYNDPKLRNLVQVLGANAGLGVPSYFRQQDQGFEGDFGKVGGMVADVPNQIVSGIWDTGFGLGYNIAALAYKAITGKEPVGLPTHAIVDDNGEVVTNAGKLPTFNEFSTAIQATIFGHEVQTDLNNANLAEHYGNLRRSGMPEIVHSVSNSLGMFAGMTIGAGPAMAVSGNLARFGIINLVGADRLARMAPWAKRLIGYSVKGAEAAGNGLANGLMFGQYDGFRTAFEEGAAMTIPLMAFGALGKKLETAMSMLSRDKMPKFAQRLVSGAVQGAGFAGYEIAKSPELWNFLKEPSEETWAQWNALIRTNVISMAIFHGFTGTTPGQEAIDRMRGLGPEVTRDRVREQRFERRAAETAADERRAAPPETGLTIASPSLMRQGEVEAPPEPQRYTVEGRPGRTLPVVEHEGYTPGGVAGALERGEPSKHVGEREVSHEEAARKTAERRRAGQRGRDPLEDPGFQEFPQELREALISAKDVKQRREIWNEAAPNILADRVEALRGEVERAGVTQEIRQKWLDIVSQSNMTAAERAVPRWGKVSEALEPQSLAKIAKDLRAIRATREVSLGEALLEGNQQEIERARAESRARVAGESRTQDRLADLEKTYKKLARDPRAAELYNERRKRFDQKQALDRMMESEKHEQTIHHRHEFPHNAPDPAGRLTVEGKEGVEPIHAIDVIRETMVGPVQPAVQSGHMGRVSRRMRGYFNTREDLIRMRSARDLNNHAHELGHAFFEKYRDRMDLSEAALQELMDVGSPTSTAKMTPLRRYHEGMAEFTARFLFGDPELRRKWPHITREVLSFLGAPEQVGAREQLLRSEKAYRRWYEQGALNQLRMSWMDVGEGMSKQETQLELDKPLEKLGPLTRARVHWRRGLREFRHAMINDLAKAEDAQKEAFKKAGIDPLEVPITANPMRMISTLRGKGPAVLETFLFRRAIGFGGTVERGGSLRDALAEIKPEERAQFIDYLVSLRNLEAMQKGLETQLSRQHYLLGVEAYGNKRFEIAARQLKKWFDNLVDYSADAGAITRETAEKIKGSWAIYIPFFRALQGPKMIAPGRGVAERGSGLQHMKSGSSIEILDPLESAIEVGMSIIQKAHQAASMQAFNTLHLTQRGMGRFVTEVPRGVAAKQFQIESIATALGKVEGSADVQMMGQAMRSFLRSLPPGDAESLATIFFQATRPSGSEPIIAFVPKYTAEEIARYFDHPPTKKGFSNLAQQMWVENGKLKWLRIHPDAYEAVMSIDPSTMLNHPILRALTLPTRAVKWGATAFNPDFIMRNIARDTVMYSLFTDAQTRNKFVPAVGAAMNFVEGLRLQAGGSEPVKILRDIGGHQATYFQREFSLTPKSHEVLNPSFPGEAYRRLLHALATPEVTLRTREAVAIRERALAEGKSELEANLEMLEAAQEVTINYIRAGAIGRALNHWIPYFNPGIQGARKLTLALADPQKRWQAIAQGLANVTLPSVVLWLLFRDEDWYQDLPDWRRNNYWTFPLPFSEKLITIPKPFEAGKIFGNVPEYMLNQIQGEPVPASEMLWDLFVNFIGGFDFMPALIGPTAENVMNYSLFRGRELVPDWMEEGRMPQDQYTAYTTGVARWLGKQFNISPIKVENFVSGYSGGAGLKAMRWLDQLIGKPPEQTPGVAISDIPGIGTFFRQDRHQQSAFVQEIYDLQRELTQRAGSGMLSPEQAGMANAVRNAKELIGDIMRNAREGRMTQKEANQRAYEVARPVIEAYRQATR